MNTPDPEQLRPLLEAGLAIMSPHDPDRKELQASLILSNEPRGHRLTLAAFGDKHTYGSGLTAEAAASAFRANYKAPKSPAERAAELRAEADRLEAGK